MLKKLPFIIAFASVALGATSAQALSISYSAGAAASNLQGTTIFQDFNSLTPGQPFGSGLAVHGPTTDGLGAVPAFGSSGNYLAVRASNTSSVTLSVPFVQVLSFVIGSLDDFNQVTLKFASGAPNLVLKGSAIINQPVNYLDGVAVNGNQFIALTNGRVFYDTQGLDSIVGFELTSIGKNAFEIDNVSIAVPEPATWGMMILAAGMAGTALRRRRNRAAMA